MPISQVRSADGVLVERSVRQLSGGERRRIALALALGFAELTAHRGHLRSNLIVLDEVDVPSCGSREMEYGNIVNLKDTEENEAILS